MRRGSRSEAGKQARGGGDARRGMPSVKRSANDLKPPLALALDEARYPQERPPRCAGPGHVLNPGKPDLSGAGRTKGAGLSVKGPSN